MDSGSQWKPGSAFRPIWDSSAGCTCISELLFTPGLESIIVRFKRHPIVQGDVLFQFNIIPHNLSNFLRLFSCKHSEVHSIDHQFNNSLDYEKDDKLLSPYLDSCISVKVSSDKYNMLLN
ncbi:unnamed protein product [Schistosoma curassoni]|uniref:Uncharacterized protein n=1 Tax=Schistosoma curassoni TaxID=6186 RepID=A0A183K0Q8_9TREM|nr:unnamed protein product [Schistosoma curassoni]